MFVAAFPNSYSQSVSNICLENGGRVVFIPNNELPESKIAFPQISDGKLLVVLRSG